MVPRIALMRPETRYLGLTCYLKKLVDACLRKQLYSELNGAH